jgi:hypothetical protein
MNSLDPQDQTLVFMAVVVCLMISFVTLFWSIEDQRAKRRIDKR